MKQKEAVLNAIIRTMKQVAPNAKVILYGSAARGEDTAQSDIDLLILVDKDTLTHHDRTAVAYPLYDIEFDTGIIISPMVLSRKDWETRHQITPFYENVKKEGIRIC